MLSRRKFGALAIAAVSSTLPEAEARERLKTPLLFSIERSKNTNIVQYRARASTSGLDLKRPIEAYWRMLAEDGRREELTWAERSLAYGFALTSVSTTSCVLHLKAFEARSLQVQQQDGEFRA